MPQRLVIVGGGAGGPSAAAKAKRTNRDLDIHMFEKGPYVSYAACPTPYFIADWIHRPEQIIARTPEAYEKAGIHVHVNTSVESLDLKRGLATDSQGAEWTFDYLVYATGAGSSLPDIPGIRSSRVFTLKNLQDALAIKSFLGEKRPKRAVILGAGFIAMEMCEAFRERGLEVDVLYRGELPVKRMGPDYSSLILEELEQHGVRFVPGASPTSIVEEQGRLRVDTTQGAFSADLVMVALGVRPTTDLAKAAGIRLGDTGGVRTDASQRTNIPNVYAAGDCVETFHLVSRRPVYMALGDIANKQGRIAGTNVAGGQAVFPGIVGSWSFKVFGLEVGYTGLNEEEARAAGFHPIVAAIEGRSRAGEYPGGTPVRVRLVADRPTGKLLGAQTLGREGAVSRANIVAACLHKVATLEELAFMDFAYAPPFSPAWDPLHIAAQECMKQL